MDLLWNMNISYGVCDGGLLLSYNGLKTWLIYDQDFVASRAYSEAYNTYGDTNFLAPIFFFRMSGKRELEGTLRFLKGLGMSELVDTAPTDKQLASLVSSLTFPFMAVNRTRLVNQSTGLHSNSSNTAYITKASSVTGKAIRARVTYNKTKDKTTLVSAKIYGGHPMEMVLLLDHLMLEAKRDVIVDEGLVSPEVLWVVDWYRHPAIRRCLKHDYVFKPLNELHTHRRNIMGMINAYKNSKVMDTAVAASANDHFSTSGHPAHI
jgi:hypothetical protein